MLIQYLVHEEDKRDDIGVKPPIALIVIGESALA